MMKSLMGAAVVLSIALVGPAMAEHATAYSGHHTWSTDCTTIETGDCYSRVHHGAGSGWRDSGDWDRHHDGANPMSSARTVGPDPLLPFGE